MIDRPISKIIVHCSATPPNLDIGVNEIKEWHTRPKSRKGNGWSDIGYHDVIPRCGGVEVGRPLSIQGAHTRGHNKGSIGICLVGGVDSDDNPENNFTKAQFKSLERLLRCYKAQFPKATIHGHNEFSNKACPSFNVQEWLKEKKLL